MKPCSFQLSRNAFGRLMLIMADGQIHENVVPVRAFPISAPESGLSLVDGDGHECVWIEQPSELDAMTKALIEATLADREFMPCILRLEHVSSFSTPSTWRVSTDRGGVTFVLRGEEDIRRLGVSSMLITDSHGVQFLIRDLTALDKSSRRLLDRFL